MGDFADGSNPSPVIQTYLFLVTCTDTVIKMMYATSSQTPPEALEILCSDPESKIAIAAVQNENHTIQSLKRLAEHSKDSIRMNVAKHKQTDLDTVFKLAKDHSDAVRQAAVDRLIDHPDAAIRLRLINEASLTREDLNQLQLDPDGHIIIAATKSIEALDKFALESFLDFEEITTQTVFNDVLETYEAPENSTANNLLTVNLEQPQLDLHLVEEIQNTKILKEAKQTSVQNDIIEEGFFGSPESGSLEILTEQEPNFDLFDLQPKESIEKPRAPEEYVESLLRNTQNDQERITQLVVDICKELNWEEGYQDLVELFEERAEKSVLTAIAQLRFYELRLDEFLLASRLKLIWEENEHYWIRVKKRKIMTFQYANLSWKKALTIIRGFPNYPDKDELHSFIEEEYYWWKQNGNNSRCHSYANYLYQIALHYPNNIELGCLSQKRKN